MGNQQQRAQKHRQYVTTMIHYIPWNTIQSLKIHQQGNWHHYAYFHFGYDHDELGYYGQFATSDVWTHDFSRFGLHYDLDPIIYRLKIKSSRFKHNVQIYLTNVQNHHEFKISLHQHRVLKMKERKRAPHSSTMIKQTLYIQLEA